MQNELLKVMALTILREVASSIDQSKFISIMCDECTESTREQLAICIRWLNCDLEPQEDVIGLYKVDDITADTIAAVIWDTLKRMNLSMLQCRSQCYDGASNMSGAKKG